MPRAANAALAATFPALVVVGCILCRDTLGFVDHYGAVTFTVATALVIFGLSIFGTSLHSSRISGIWRLGYNRWSPALLEVLLAQGPDLDILAQVLDPLVININPSTPVDWRH